MIDDPSVRLKGEDPEALASEIVKVCRKPPSL